MSFLQAVSGGLVHRVCAAAALAVSIALAPACAASPAAPEEARGDVTYTAVGASDAIGIGASVSCLPFVACPNGTGYVQVIGRRLAEGGSRVNLLNLGIPAAVLSPRVQTISYSYGPRVDFNFLERQLPFVDRGSTVVTIFAGGNDTSVVARSVSGQSGGNPRGYVEQQIALFAGEMASLVDGIRDRAPGARIVIANLPNFAGAPFAARYSMHDRSVVQQISVGFSRQGINPLASRPNVAVVDLLCDDGMYSPSSYSPDGFHPNDNGYAIMAGLMFNAIRNTNYPVPSGSCGRMSIVPSL